MWGDLQRVLVRPPLPVDTDHVARYGWRGVPDVGAATAEHDELRALLAAAGAEVVVSVHTPLTAETRHLIDARRLTLMRPTAVLINTSRGPVVDEAALTAALRVGAIAGAGLDVYEHEPRVTEGLLELENVVLAPHVGSATRDTRVAMGMLCVSALRAVLLEGRTPANVVP